ncbi:MAG: thiol-disulfide oxidoreductase DCC family protein [Myxococcota bacterium]
MVAPPPIVLYDGTCGFCDASVRWLLAHDRAGVFRYAPLQGETAASLRARHPEIPADIDTLVLVEGDRVSLRSTAVARILARLPSPWRVLGWLRVVPRPLRDLGYRAFAAVRYRVWGRVEACRVPRPEERERFLP